MSDNMDLWNRVWETDPDQTKKVTFGRGFTAIDPMWQVHNATEQFGPAGKGWGWKVVDTKFLPTNYVACLVRVWHESPERYIEQWGQCGMYLDKDQAKPDQDCMKKATTDGMTKCLSYFGFNADVFLGKFDDNKYVEQMRHKKQPDVVQKAKKISEEFPHCKTLKELHAVWERKEVKEIEEENQKTHSWLKSEYTKHLNRLSQAPLPEAE